MTTMLVCGGRNYGRLPAALGMDRAARLKADKDAFILREALDHLRRERGVTKVISGGQSGADTLAHRWALSRSIRSIVIRAEWRKHGRSAGPIRNGRMLELKPDFVVAFTGGAGTADMIRQARAAGVEVIDYRQDEP